MKIIGMMCVKNEADLLPQVYPHIRENVDLIYAYDDGSTDNTWDFIKHSDYAIRRVNDHARENIWRPNYHHLLNRIFGDFNGSKEEIWIVITMGDRFFLNKKPRQIVEEARGFDCVHGIQLDFLRPSIDPWTEKNDPAPDMSKIRHLARWFRHDERCVVAYKLQPQLSYRKSKLPWPRGLAASNVQYGGLGISIDMPFLEHQGRRTPKAYRARGKEPSDVFFKADDLLPWVDNSSLELLVDMENNAHWNVPPRAKYFRMGLEYMAKKGALPPRRDI